MSLDFDVDYESEDGDILEQFIDNVLYQLKIINDQTFLDNYGYDMISAYYNRRQPT